MDAACHSLNKNTQPKNIAINLYKGLLSLYFVRTKCVLQFVVS